MGINTAGPFHCIKAISPYMRQKGVFRLEIPEKLNMARFVLDFWAEHGRGQDAAIYAVLESGVAGVVNPEMGEKVKAWVVLHEGFNATPELARELQDHVKATIAPYKYPREIEFLKELPKTSSGKILRRRLRQWDKKSEAKRRAANDDIPI